MQRTKGKTNKGITLIALVITIIVLIILAGISISLVLGQNGLFNKAKSAATETAKARFLEDAGFAYSEAYIEKVETSNANDITIGDVVSKLKSSYGYTDGQIKTVTSGVSGITLSETEVTLEPGETKDITVALENGTYYALIEGLYYPITLSNGEVALGEGIVSLPEGDGTTSKIDATVAEESGIEVSVVGNKITITANKEQEEASETIVTVSYGEGISKEIKVKIKVEVKQGDLLPLDDVTVRVGDSEIKLAKGWKYFYNDEENGEVWLIYDGRLEGEAQQVEGAIGNKDDLISYLNGTDSYAGKWDHIKIGIKNALKAKGINVEDNQIKVKGSPDIKLFQKAYNQMYPDEILEIDGDDTLGWKYRFGGSENFENGISDPHHSGETLFYIWPGYFLGNPSAERNDELCCVGTNIIFYLNLDATVAWDDNFGARPVVSIPKTAFDQLVK